MARMESGRVSTSRSLLPRTSRFQASKRAPRKSCSSRRSAWIMVPIAPSSTKMRSAASCLSGVSFWDADLVWDADLGIGLRALRFRLQRRAGAGILARPKSEQMADRVNQIGAVHGIEVEVGHAVIDEIQHLFGRDGSGDQLAGRSVGVEAIEAIGKPFRNGRAAARGKGLRGLEVLNRQNSRHDRNIDTGSAHAI